MTRAWAPRIALIQDAIAAAILTERDAVAGSLPAPLQGPDFDVIAAANRTGKFLLPNGLRVLPPANSTLETEITRGIEGILAFPVIVRVQTIADLDLMDLLREAQGLVIDALGVDPTLGGACGGLASPAIALGPIDTDGGAAEQEITVRLVARE